MWAYIANSFVIMCGIAGIISTQKDFVQQSHLQKMADALAHRGPNAEGFWMNETNLLDLPIEDYPSLI